MTISAVAVFPPRQNGWKTFFLLIAALFKFVAPVAASEKDSLLIRARAFFYAGLKDKNKIDSAIVMFTRIGRLDTTMQGRMQTYIGSLTAVKAKHAFWPHQKWKWAKSGLRIMDAGLAQCPYDLEALFIHGMTCYYLPKFFGRSDDVQRHLHALVRLLPEHVHEYDPKIMANVIKFLLDKIKLTEEERWQLMTINTELAQK